MHAHRRRSSEAVDPFLRPALQPWARAGHHHLEPSSRTHHARADGSEAITWDENISGFPRSGGGTHPYTFGHDAVAREAPERDQQLARQRHDQRLARRRGIRGSLPIPFGERTVLLEQEKPPRQLDHPAPHARVARAGQSLFTPLGPAFVGRAGKTGITRNGATIPHVP